MYSNNRPQFLDQLVANHRLTPDGRDWLTLALDPFHDQNHQAAGYPDADGSQTLVSCYQYQLDVTAPAGVAGNWDAHIFTLPVCNTQVYTVGTEDAGWGSIVEDAPLVQKYLGPLNVITAPAGSVLIPTAPDVVNQESHPVVANNCLDLVSGVTRVIGMGYEVTNTTSELNKQGAVTSYRMPQYFSEVGTEAIYTNNLGRVGSPPSRKIRMPPAHVAQANLLKGTRTWDAAAGVYATMAQNSVHNPLRMAHNEMIITENLPFSGAPSKVWMSPYVGPSAGAPALSATTPLPTQTIPFDTTGSFFTGLSPNTTLTVKFKVYVERAPTMAEPNLSVLATPSAGLDTVALELYSHAISQLPVAVTVGENGLGDWFRGVIRVLRSVAGTATSVLGPFVPGARQVGSAVQTVLGTMDSFMPKKPAPSVSSTIRPRPVQNPPKKKSKNKQVAPRVSRNSQLAK